MGGRDPSPPPASRPTSLKRQLTNVTHVPIDEFPPSVRELFSKFDKVGTAASGVLCFRSPRPRPR